MANSGLSRRGLLGAGAATFAATALSLPTTALGQTRRRGRRARNIILCVSDGMCASIPSMVNQLSHLKDGKPSIWATLMAEPDVVSGLQTTSSLNSLVTDSSAASSSWGSGRHIWNGQVNAYPDGTELRTLCGLMHDAGLRTGLVTTATITHATPAGFAVSCILRDLEHVIAEKYLKSGVDVLMGGGDQFFNASRRKDKRDLYADFGKAGYEVVRDRSSMLASKKDRVLGIYSSSHLPYTVDRDNDPKLQETVPTLAEMAKSAIEKLNGKGKGFLLQIEGAKIDHGAHANDIAAAFFDQVAFEDAVKVAVDFARKDGNTLVVVTSDHGTGGPALNGAGDEYSDSTAGLQTLLKMKSSYGAVLGDVSGKATAENIRGAVEARLGIALTAEEAQTVSDAMAGTAAKSPSEFHRGAGPTLAMVLGNHTKVGWTGGNHVSDHVIVSALGPGSQNFAGITENIRFFDIFLDQHGLRHSNPTMDLARAKAEYAKLKERIAQGLVSGIGPVDTVDAEFHQTRWI